MRRHTHLAGNEVADFVRFMAFTDVPGNPTACWDWQANKIRNGYGHFALMGKSVKAHRWIYERVVGPIPEGLMIRHKCDNPSCVNPLHLEVGTSKQNCADMIERGRGADRKGEKHPMRKLNADDIRAIRRRAACGESRSSISRDYPVGRGQIDKIVNGQNWSHVQ